MTATVSLIVLALLQLLGSSLAASRCLDFNCLYRMDWSSSSNVINITLTANTSGWIGLGFSPNGGMTGSDIVTSYVDLSGNIVLQDRHAVAEALPVLDKKQDYKLISGRRKDGQLIVTFTRPLDTCDKEDAVITPYTTKVIYAFGDLDSTGTPIYHEEKNRGVHSMYLLEAQPPVLAEDDLFSIDPVPQLITVPAEPTIYWCSLVKLPTVANKSHIVAMEPVIWENNTDLVHHMLVYGCDSVNTNFSSYECSGDPSKNGGNSLTCLSLFGVWAVGGEAYVLPSEAGLPFGGSHGPEYILTQTHYNNVQRQSGRTDASYMRFKATKRLRPNDAGVLQVGIVQGLLIPPNTGSMNVGGYCTNNCLSSKNLPETGIRAFAVMLHSHLLGRAITLRHFRSSQNTQLPVVASDPYYDFAYQQMRNLEKETLILPGDILQTVCSMNSTDRKLTTLGGPSTMQEMCLSFIFYYPRTDIKLCETFPRFVNDDADPIYKILNISRKSFIWYRAPYQGLDLGNWTSEMVSQMEDRYFNGTSIDSCVTNSTVTGLWNIPDVVRSPVERISTSPSECDMMTSKLATPMWSDSRGAAMNLQPSATLRLWIPAAMVLVFILRSPVL